MIQRRQFRGRRLVRIQNTRQQPIGRLGVSDEHFAVMSDLPSNDKPYSVRFIDSPYSPFVSRSIRVVAHNRGTRISPLNIRAVLAKFAITDAQFRSAYDLFIHNLPAEGEAADIPTAKPN